MALFQFNGSRFTRYENGKLVEYKRGQKIELNDKEQATLKFVISPVAPVPTAPVPAAPAPIPQPVFRTMPAAAPVTPPSLPIHHPKLMSPMSSPFARPTNPVEVDVDPDKDQEL